MLLRFSIGAGRGLFFGWQSVWPIWRESQPKCGDGMAAEGGCKWWMEVVSRSNCVQVIDPAPSFFLAPLPVIQALHLSFTCVLQAKENSSKEVPAPGLDSPLVFSSFYFSSLVAASHLISAEQLYTVLMFLILNTFADTVIKNDFWWMSGKIINISSRCPTSMKTTLKSSIKNGIQILSVFCSAVCFWTCANVWEKLRMMCIVSHFTKCSAHQRFLVSLWSEYKHCLKQCD